MSRKTERRRWTEAEDRLLRERYATSPILDLAGALRRSVGSIRHRAGLLRLKSARSWSAKDDDALRESWGKVRTQVLAKEIGRSPWSLKQRARKLGLDSERYWTDEDRRLLTEMYSTHTAPEIAEALGMPRRAALAVYRMAHLLGLRKSPSHSPELIERIRQLHADGLNDAEIGRRIGMNRSNIHHIRWALLKLPPNEEGVRRARRRGIETQWKTFGVENGGQFRRLSFRRYAVENGWPEDLRPREVQILNVLAAKGVPMTRFEIAQAIGMRTDRIRCDGSTTLPPNA